MRRLVRFVGLTACLLAMTMYPVWASAQGRGGRGGGGGGGGGGGQSFGARSFGGGGGLSGAGRSFGGGAGGGFDGARSFGGGRGFDAARSFGGFDRGRSPGDFGGGRGGPSLGARSFDRPSFDRGRTQAFRDFDRRSFSGIAPRAPSNLFRGDRGDLARRGGDFDKHRRHDRHHRHWGFGRYGFYPWWAGWGLGWGYPGLYGYDGYPYYDYGLYRDGYPYGVASVPYGEEASAPATVVGAESDYFDQALSAFRSGNYQEALRQAGHAAIEMRNDARPHELASLALFALGDYRGAAAEAHAALALGQPADWQTLYSYYNNLPTYQGQLQALQDHAGQNPDDLAAKFLLAYHNLMMGHRDQAKQQLEDVVKAQPEDQIAAGLLRELGGSVPAPEHKAPAPAGQQ